MNKPSLKKNLALSAVKAISSIIFPLITFKYAANIFTVANTGKVNYVSSINSLIAMFAALGLILMRLGNYLCI